MERTDRRRSVAFIAPVLLVVVAVVLGTNMLIATSRIVDAYDAYDGLELSLESFQYETPNDPVTIKLRVGNPSDQPLDINAIDLRLAAGVRTVGGASIQPDITLAPGESTVLTIDAAINEPNYVEQLTGSIEWIINGRIQVELEHSEPTWVPFGTRYVS